MSQTASIRREIAMLEAQVKELLERITVLQQTLRSEPPERVTMSFEAGFEAEAHPKAPPSGAWLDPSSAHSSRSSHSSAGRYAYVQRNR